MNSYLLDVYGCKPQSNCHDPDPREPPDDEEGYTGRDDTAYTQDNEYGNGHTGQRAIHHPEALSKLDKAAHEDETRDQKKR